MMGALSWGWKRSSPPLDTIHSQCVVDDEILGMVKELPVAKEPPIQSLTEVPVVWSSGESCQSGGDLTSARYMVRDELRRAPRTALTASKRFSLDVGSDATDERLRNIERRLEEVTLLLTQALTDRTHSDAESVKIARPTKN